MRKNGYWYTTYYCKQCDGRVSLHIKMNVNGRCPLCGCKGENAGTIMDTYEIAERFVRTVPKWKFWIMEKGYYETKEKTDV